MGAVASRDQVVREDLGNAVMFADVKNTPIITRMRKGDRLKAMEFSWTVGRMAERKPDAVPENQDVKSFEGDSEKKLYGRAQKFWRTPRVTTEAEEVNEPNEGSELKFRKQKAKKAKAQIRDIEFKLCSDDESGEDEGLPNRGSRIRGLGRMLQYDTLQFTDTHTAPDAEFRTPASQVYTGALADLTENDVNEMMQYRWEKTGATSEFVLFCASRLKTHISKNFGKYEPNKEGYTVIVRAARGPDIDRRKLVTKGIDVVEGDYGAYEVELEPFMPTLHRGYGLAMEEMRKRWTFWGRFSPLPYLGGGKSGLIETIMGYEPGDLRSHFQIRPSDEVAADPNAGGELEEV